jgi:SAM-dependent methyltransferase
MRALAAKHADALQPGENWTKYFDAARWLKLNIRRAQDIGLDRERRSLRVLDLGSGAGYFLFVCKHLGHPGMGLDLPNPAFYGEMFAALGLTRVISPVDPQLPLPEALLSGGKFDLVTALSVAFNRYSPTGLWTAADWDYLLDDLRTRFLNPGGRVYFDLNPNYEDRFTTPEIEALFLRRGGKFDRGSKVLFAPLR